MARVDELLRGVTTLTTHARYFTLHSLVALEAEEKGLDKAQARTLLRRAEIALGAISLAHGSPYTTHAGVPGPHGGVPIGARLAATGVDVPALLPLDGGYSPRPDGFWSQYLGSESVLGLVDRVKGVPTPGKNVDRQAVRKALGDLLGLAQQDLLDLATLKQHQHLCMCRSAKAVDGTMLRRLFIPKDVQKDYPEDKRRQTLRLLFRVLDISGGVTNVQDDLSRLLMFDQTVATDSTVRAFDAFPAWVGVALRARSVEAWRDLWSWLVAQIGGYMPLTALTTALGDALPNGTVKDFRNQLPATHTVAPDGTFTLLPAEYDLGQVLDTLVPAGADRTPVWALAQLALGAARVGHLDERTSVYFEHSREERFQQLTPTWMRDRLNEWNDRPLKDFAAYLTDILVARSQRLAMRKARFNPKQMRFEVPSRVYLRDDYIFKDSAEGGGGISLRFDSAIYVMSGVGFVERRDGKWGLTDRGRAA